MALHWLLALMILASLGVGLYMTGLPFSPQRLQLYNWHKWAGVTILVLSALRLLWRLTHRPPARARKRVPRAKRVREDMVQDRIGCMGTATRRRAGIMRSSRPSRSTKWCFSAAATCSTITAASA